MSNFTTNVFLCLVKVLIFPVSFTLVITFSSCSPGFIFEKSDNTLKYEKIKKKLEDPNYDIRLKRKTQPWHDVKGTYLHRNIPDSLLSDAGFYGSMGNHIII